MPVFSGRKELLIRSIGAPCGGVSLRVIRWPTSARPLVGRSSQARARGVVPAVEWDLVTKSPEEARFHSPLYLDMVSDAVLLFDRDGFFEQILRAMRERMSELGSRRVALPDGSWYWDLKPDYRFGERVEI